MARTFTGPCRKCGEHGHKARACIDQGRAKTKGKTYQKASEACVSLATRASGTDSESAATELHHAATDKPPEPKTASRTVNAKTADAANLNADRAEPQTPADRSHTPVQTPPVETTTKHTIARTPSGTKPQGEDRGEAAGGVKDAREGVSDEEQSRAHERVDNPANGADTSTDETAAKATASAYMDAAHLTHQTARRSRGSRMVNRRPTTLVHTETSRRRSRAQGSKGARKVTTNINQRSPTTSGGVRSHQT